MSANLSFDSMKPPNYTASNGDIQPEDGIPSYLQEVEAVLNSENLLDLAGNSYISSSPTRQQASLNEDEALKSVQYGKIKLFSPWFPTVDPGHKRLVHWRSRRKTILIFAWGTSLAVLFANIGITLYAMIRYKGTRAVVPIYEGNCEWVGSVDTALHILINILSTGLLGASNLCMQLLVAPTREEIDGAHRQNKWLDIGVPSIRNLLRIKWQRVTMWACLALSSIPLHFIYNSAVSSSIPSFGFGAAVVSEPFLHQAPWGDAALSDRISSWPPEHIWNRTAALEYMQQRALNKEDFVNLTKRECLNVYTDIYRNRTNLLVVIDDLPSDHNSSVIRYEYISARWSTIDMHWLCEYHSTHPGHPDCVYMKENTQDILDQWTMVNRPVRYCLSQRRTDDYCRLNYSPVILIAICIISGFKVACISWVAYRYREPTICTLGDAICSFLEREDERTAHMGIASKDEFNGKKPLIWHTKRPVAWRRRNLRWYSLASKWRWAFAAVIFFVIFIAAVLQFVFSVRGTMERGVYPTFSSVMDMEFGAPHHTAFTAYFLNHYGPGGFLANVIWANYWQTIVSGLYFAVNALLTCMLLGYEWANYATKRKPLRVSHPRGIQRSSYFISMPFRYGIPLMASSTTIHWLVSRSIFLVNTTTFYPNAIEDEDSSFVTIGYSPKATFIAIIMGTFFFLVFIGYSFRKMPSGMPLVSSCSAAISAACHRPSEDTDAHLLPILWGVVDEPGPMGEGNEKPGRCSFTTSRNVRQPEEGEVFGGVVHSLYV